MNEVPKWFSDTWVPEFLLPSKIIWMFGPKTAIFAPKYAFLGTYRPCRLIWCPVGWLVGGCGAQAVSRTTPFYFIIILNMVAQMINFPFFSVLSCRWDGSGFSANSSNWVGASSLGSLMIGNWNQVRLKDSDGQPLPNGEHPNIHWNRLKTT